MTKKRDTVTTKLKDVHLSVKQHIDFANKEMGRSEVEVVEVSQEQDASLPKAEQLSSKCRTFPA